MPKFVIQKHKATNLHYDFRLEISGKLKSWAIPKIPPKKSGIKRLAIQVPDHALSYANFEGIIPEGSYGAGTVEIWDSGTYEMKSKHTDKLVFVLHGKKLTGEYCLILFKPKKDTDNKKKWLFFKAKSNSD